ncbi:MAG: squalene/phytoene synthase family protein [Caldilinea sp.]
MMIDYSGSFRLTPTQKSYLGKQLDKVSRSFAILIPYIEPPLRHYLAVAYLLCRVADNIEDCGQPNPWKQARFTAFVDLLQEPRRAPGQLAAWEKDAWPGLSQEERQIMGVAHGLTLWQIYAMIPDHAQAVIRQWVGVMVAGMSKLSDPDEQPCFVQRKGIDILETEQDYNEYCYYVAGTVGALASELVVQQYELGVDVSAILRLRADSCGRSLQKTNIVKDFVEDVTRGVCYLPDVWLRIADYAPLELRGATLAWKERIISDVLHDLRDAADYTLALPHHVVGYRRASLLCLFPAYHTLLSAAQRQETLFTPAHQIKISRGALAQCISDSDKVLLDDDAIRRYCTTMESKIYAGIGRFHQMP